MKILVIEDNPLHIAGAKAQLKGHDLTVADSHEKGRVLLNKYHGFCPTYEQIDFDVVLVDLMMPPSEAGLERNLGFTESEMPMGIFLALMAATRGAKYVAVVTDMNHHKHPASAALDMFNRPFSVNGATVRLENYNVLGRFHMNDLSKRASHEEERADCMREEDQSQLVLVKKWARILESLLDPTSKDCE
ncbi:MAG: hypothetical protein V4674_01910 [Patescibacteria group bacterium]